MKIPLLYIDGKNTSSIEVSDKIFKSKINYKLIKSVIDWQLNHAKPRTAKTKQRNQIKGSTKKIVPQKGGGGARHASKKAPLFVGGGVAHGPKGAVYKVKKINKTEWKVARRNNVAVLRSLIPLLVMILLSWYSSFFDFSKASFFVIFLFFDK